ncbi:MAG TPA: nitroreductase family deazaflavin-dependent oxidoreductase [Pseudonocardia sp.]|jgi:deazaflavin-dependent oxidoreductase (nitroreductase family)|nr:nitroreductase family deazaflavin-dependent oxidoreductase [Pseudonocardia sp.]
MTDVNEWNRQIVEEFRSNDGRVGGQFANIPLLLLRTKGARSGAERINPLAYQRLDSGYAIFGSYAGAPKNPAWFHNLMADPKVTIEVGTSTVPVTARVADGAERERIWEQQKTEVPAFAGYESKTDRTIPVIVLEPDNR